MNPKLLNTLSGLAASGVLLTIGLLSSGADDARPQAATEGSPLAGTLDAIEADAVQAGEEAKTPPRRRARATLSMPYFSFAQSLRPRG